MKTAALTLTLFLTTFAWAAEPASREALWQQIEPFTTPPAEFAGKLGDYRSPLVFRDESLVKTAKDWPRRRAEILARWH